jgi:hypothetical protein
MHDDEALSMGCCFMAKLITGIPTWQFWVHSRQPMHLSLAWM